MSEDVSSAIKSGGITISKYPICNENEEEKIKNKQFQCINAFLP
jgi:hypothetical protein